MELKGRLKLIADKTPSCNIVCDIGTDHAYIPIHLVKNSVCEKAVASDVKEGPVLIARENIKSSGLDEHIEARMGDGLESIAEDESDVVIIAGMGGVLISQILDKGLAKAKKAHALILQPMNAIDVLRKWLYQNGFDIYDEQLASEGEKIYNVICARWTGHIGSKEDIYYQIGEKLIERKDPLLKNYIVKKLKQLDKVLIEMKSSNTKESQAYVAAFKLKEAFSNLFNTL